MVELPWTKREVIDTVIAEYRPGSAEPFVFVMVRMFSRLALGRPEGRAAPYLEHALCARINVSCKHSVTAAIPTLRMNYRSTRKLH